jgi:uridylate kinase
MPATTSKKPKYRRIVLKISGEALRNDKTGEAIDSAVLDRLAEELRSIQKIGTQVAVVVGGGNIFRGLAGARSNGTDRTTGDNMGMLATVINGLALMDRLEKAGLEVRVMTAIPMDRIAEPFIQRRATRHLERGRIVIFVAGTGNPYCTTDYASALRANEIGADAILKATKVDGVYDKDPMKFKDAKRYEKISHAEALTKRLGVMDAEAFSLCEANKLPINFNKNEWIKASTILRLEHELTHLSTMRILGEMRLNLLDELVADTMGQLIALGKFSSQIFINCLEIRKSIYTTELSRCDAEYVLLLLSERADEMEAVLRSQTILSTEFCRQMLLPWLCQQRLSQPITKAPGWLPM